MKYWKYPFFVLLAGLCTSLFFYVRSFPIIRFYTASGADSGIFWTASSLPRLGGYILITSLILVVIWLIYSFVYSSLSGEKFKHTLQLDAYTYLPLCILAISLLQWNTPLTKGFVLLTQSGGYFLLLISFIAIYHLKAQNLGTPTPTLSQEGNYTLTQAPRWKIKLVIFLISFLLYALVGNRVMKRLELGGDEPHYLLITHSLLQDRDLAIKNNYTQRDYQAFFPADLQPHVSLGKDGTRYPGHPIGLSVLLIPFYALKGRQGVVLFMNFLAALLALQLYELAFSVTQHRRLALLIWFVTSFTSPLLLYSSQIYPEVPSALLLAIAYRKIAKGQWEHPPTPLKGGKKLFHAYILGGTLALLPWIQQRMILPTIILILYYIITSEIPLWRKPRKTHQLLLISIPVLFVAVSGIAMAGYYYTLYGTPLPNAPYTSIGMKTVFSLDIFLKQGLLGLFLDQEGGLLIYSPYYVFLFAGFLLLIRYHFTRVVWLFFLIMSIYIPCGGFILKWRGAWSPASRYMVALIPFLLPLLGEALRRVTRRIYWYTFFFLIAISFSWSYLFLRTPFLSIMRGKGINNLLEQSSNNIVDPSRYFPAFNEATPTGIYILAGLWIAVIVVFSVSFYRSAKLNETPQKKIITNVKKVFGFYGLLLGLLVIFTFVSEHVESNIAPQLAKNKYLRDFLYNFNHYAQLTTQQPMPPEDLRFEYLSKEKWGRVNPKGGARFLVSGPHEPFPAGKYTAYFKVLVEDNSADDIVVTVEVVKDRGEHVFNRAFLRGIDFSIAGEYELIPLPFELPEDVTDLETRVYFHNRVNVRVQKVYIEPDLSEFYYHAGISAFQKEHYDGAKSLFLQALSISEHVQASYQIGIIEQLSHNWESSLKIFQQVIERDPKCADAHYRLGMAFKENREFKRAQQCFERATRLLPTHLDAWNALQDIYRLLGMNAEVKNVEQTIHTLYQPQHPYAINFGNQVMFLGYSINTSALGTLQLEYYWKALSPMQTDYFFFVHFKNFSTKFQQDHAPQIVDPLTGQNTIYPTSQWKIGELIHEKFEIPTSAGTFDIYLGIWDPFHTKERLPVVSSSQRSFFKEKKIKLRSITVKQS